MRPGTTRECGVAGHRHLTGRRRRSTIRAVSYPSRLSRRAVLCALAAVAGLLLRPGRAASQPDVKRVRVSTRHANVHVGPNTTTEVLVLVPRDSVLTVLGRDKEWIQVQLTPDLRKTGMVVRWYKNEDRGWMHDSTVTPEQ
jgi:hypothetical protein